MNRRQFTQGYKILLFIGYTLGIYICQIIAAIFQQKIYKVTYHNTINNQSDIFQDQITPNAITSGIACLIGYIFIKDQQLTWNIPILKICRIAGFDFTIHICLIIALLRTDYTTLLVVNSLSLMSVVIVGSLFSGVKNNQNQEEGNGQIRQQKIGVQKIWICLIICVGVIIFNVSGNSQSSSSQTKELFGGTLLTVMIFAIALVLQGFKPDFVQQIKQQYNPSPMFLYFSLTGTQFFISLLASIVTWKIGYFYDFVINHNGLLQDLMVYSILNAISVMFVYKLIAIFRQHIYPLVSTTRKCFTVCINVLYYGHKLAVLQWLAIILVFGGVLVQIINNYNLAQRLLPKQNIRSKQGKDYNKIIGKQQYYSPARIYNHNDQLNFEVQGI